MNRGLMRMSGAPQPGNLPWIAIIGGGTLANRPAASFLNRGFLYLATDTNGGTLYRSNGTAWVQAAGAVSGGSITIGTTAIALGGSSTSLAGLVSVINALLIGGTGTTSTLTLQSTNGVGASGADIIFKVGNNGATEAARILNSGFTGFGISPTHNVTVQQAVNVDGLRITSNTNTGTAGDITASVLFTARGPANDYGAAIRLMTVQASPLALNPRLGFFTEPAGDNVVANMVERVSVLAGGNVGVATTVPSDIFSIAEKLIVNSSGVVTKYNNTALVSGGIPAIVASVSRTAQSAAITATDLLASGSVVTGRYRVSAFAQVTTNSGSGGILGGATGIVLTFKDGAGNNAQSVTMATATSAGTPAITANSSLTTNLNGTTFINVHSGTAIQYAMGYTGGSGPAMQFSLDMILEWIGP